MVLIIIAMTASRWNQQLAFVIRPLRAGTPGTAVQPQLGTGPNDETTLLPSLALSGGAPTKCTKITLLPNAVRAYKYIQATQRLAHSLLGYSKIIASVR